MSAVSERPKLKRRQAPSRRTLEDARADHLELTRVLAEARERLDDNRRLALEGDVDARLSLGDGQRAVDDLKAQLDVLDQEITERERHAAAQQQLAREATAAATEEACRRRVEHTQGKLEAAWAAVLTAAADQVAAFGAWDASDLALASVRGENYQRSEHEQSLGRVRALGLPNDANSMRAWRDRLGEMVLRDLVGGYVPRWPGRRARREARLQSAGGNDE